MSNSSLKKGPPDDVWYMIWERTWEPRIVEIYSKVTCRKMDEEQMYSSEQYHSAAPLPVTLFIEQRSRYFTQQYYKLRFPTYYMDLDDVRKHTGTIPKEPRVYFNHNLDTLFLKDPDMFWTSNLLRRLHKRDLKWVRYLAVDDKIFRSLCTYHHEFSSSDRWRRLPRKDEISYIREKWRFITRTQNLRELCVIIGEPRDTKESQAASWWSECAQCVRLRTFTPVVLSYRVAKSYLEEDIIPIQTGTGQRAKVIASKFSDPWKQVDTVPRGTHETILIPDHRPRPLDYLHRLRQLKIMDLALPERNKLPMRFRDHLCSCRTRAGLEAYIGRLVDPETGENCRRELRSLCEEYRFLVIFGRSKSCRFRSMWYQMIQNADNNN